MVQGHISICFFILSLGFANGHIHAGYYWQITDFHYDPTYDRVKGSLSCDDNNVGVQNGQFGDMWCDSPWSLVVSSVQAMKSIREDVNFVLWSGDRVTHGPVPDLNYTFNAEIHIKTTDFMKETFPDVPVYPTFGNHDSYPKNQFDPDSSLLYNDTLELWRPWINDSAQDEGFRRGGYYTVKASSHIRIVVPNTNLYHRGNSLVLENGTLVDDPAGQFAWLDETLRNAQTNNEKVIVMTHITPGVPRPPKTMVMRPEYNDRLVDILRSYADIIVAIHVGHEHGDSFKVLTNKADTPASPLFISPSIAMGRTLAKSTDAMHNPGFRLIKYDTESGTLIEISQYYLDLTEANRAGTANWTLEYTTTDAYGLQDLSAGSLTSLIDKMKNSSSEEFMKYKKFYSVSPPENLAEDCDADCHRSVYCAFTKFTHADVDRCKDEMELGEGYYWQITDFHYDPTYDKVKDSLSCDDNNVGVQNGQFGDMWCDSPWSLVVSSVQAMKNIKSDVDFVSWTGDRVTHGPVPDLNYTFNAEIHIKTTDFMKETFPNVPVYPTFGNHDSYPKNQFDPDSSLLYNDTLELWRAWINDNAQDEGFRRGGYYTVKTSKYIRIVVPNTNLYHRGNKLVLEDGDAVDDPAGQFAWLKETLSNAQTNNEKVIVFTHIAPGVPRPPKTMVMRPAYNDELVDILRSYADIIVAIHVGHEHGDAFKVLTNKEGDPTTPLFISPSIAMGRTLAKSTDEMHNPGFRLIKYNRVTGKLMEITQYYLDITEANRIGTANWKLEYTTTDAYNLQELTGASLTTLINKMKNSNSDEFKKYKRFYSVSPPEDFADECDADCHSNIVCAFTEFTHAGVDSCVKKLVSDAVQATSRVFIVSLAFICSLYIVKAFF